MDVNLRRRSYPAGFVLQSATTPTNGTAWQEVGLTPAETNGQNAITAGPSNAAGFFRLRTL